MQNNLFLDTFFWVYNKLNIIVKIFIAIYLPLLVLSPYVPSYWYHESWVQKTRKTFHDTGGKGQLPIVVSQQRLYLKGFFLIKFDFSGLKALYSLIWNINLIHVDIIFAAPKWGFLYTNFPLTTHYLKNWPQRKTDFIKYYNYISIHI